jgi:hypothetical protein
MAGRRSRSTDASPIASTIRGAAAPLLFRIHSRHLLREQSAIATELSASIVAEVFSSEHLPCGGWDHI